VNMKTNKGHNGSGDRRVELRILEVNRYD